MCTNRRVCTIQVSLVTGVLVCNQGCPALMAKAKFKEGYEIAGIDVWRSAMSLGFTLVIPEPPLPLRRNEVE